MRKSFIMVVLVVFVTVPALAAVSVVGSKHDMIFSGYATGGGTTEVCVFCHTPHGAQVTVTQAPLWNNTAAAGVASVYNSSTSVSMNFATDETKVDATDARLCLACHDSAVGAPVNAPNIGTGIDISLTTLIGANALLGLDLSNDHPIGMDLGANPETTDEGLRTIAVIKTNFGGVTPFFGSTDDSINIMWCSSCHDVHDSDPLKKPFLRMSNADSAMCKACHIK